MACSTPKEGAIYVQEALLHLFVHYLRKTFENQSKWAKLRIFQVRLKINLLFEIQTHLQRDFAILYLKVILFFHP